MRNHNNHSMETTATTDHDARPARREPGTGNRRRVLAAFVLAGAAWLGFGTNAQAQTVPGIPTNLMATTDSRTQISLSWTAPTNTGGTGTSIAGYKIEYSAPDYPTFGMNWEVLEENTGSTAIPYTHVHVLAPDTRLEYRVSAINTVGTGEPSDVAEAFTQAAPDTAGNGAPDHTGATVNHRQIVITFDENLDANSVPNNAQFQLTISGVSRSQRPEKVDVTGATVVLTLHAEHAVDADDSVRVRYTAPGQFIGDARVPITRKALQDSEGNLVEKWNAVSATNETPLRVELELDLDTIAENGGVSTVTATMVPSSAPAPAELTVTVTTEAVSPAVAADFELSGTTLTIASGATTSTGTVTITAVNNDEDEAVNKTVTVSGTVSGSQDVSATASPVTLTIQDDDDPAPSPQLARPTTRPPGAPRSLTAAPEGGQVVLTWQAPASNGGAAIRRYEYRLQAGDGPFGEWTAIPDSATRGANAASYRIMDLTNGTAYTVEARAVTSVRKGRVARVTVTPVAPPDAPRSLTATPEDGQVVLTWQAPADNGGAAIRRYEYRLQAGDGPFGEWTAVPDSTVGGANAVSHRIMGLTNGTAYTIEVRAVTSMGEGHVARVTVTPATPPDAPGSLAATSDDGDVVLTWQAPLDNGGSAILRYEYRLQAGAGTFGEWTAIPDSATGGANAVRYRVTGLTNRTVYIVEARAVNAAGASAAVRVTVTPRSAASERFSRLNEEILALQALSLSDQTSRALTQRLATLTPGQPERAQYQLGGRHSLAQTLLTTLGTDSGPGLPGPRVDLKDLLGSSSFVLPLRLRDTGLGLDRMTLWGQGRYTRLARAHDANLDWDGDTLSAQVGADVHVRPDLLFGLAVTWADSGVDYQDRSRPGSAVGGTHENWLVNVQPYVGWRSDIGLGLWATVGHGWGELTIADEQAGRQESKVRVETAAVGLRGPLLSQTGVLGPEATTLTLRSDAAWTRVDVIGNQEDLAGRTVSAGRVRLLLEGQHTHVTPAGERLEPFVELGVRFDVGEGLTGKGVEVGGGLRYAVPRLGLTLEGRGRGMVGHRGYTEWGASGLVRVDPGVSGEGLAVHLAPTYGPSASLVQQVWTQAPGQPFGEPATGVGQPPQAGVEAEVGYGLANVAGARVFTPYGAVTLGQGGGAQYRLGGRWTGVTGLMLSVEGVRQEPAGQQPLNQGLRLRATWGF